MLERWQRRAAHLLVDEYQDTNRVQYLLVQALSARRSGNLCVVGDEDQSIYRWRGADIRNILDFERDYPRRADLQARAELPLDQDHPGRRRRRHPQQHASARIKNLWTENGAGEPVTYYTGVTERDEADFIAREIARLTGSRRHSEPADIVVFYRVNAQSRVIEEALVRRRIPYYVVGGLRFYEQRDIKDLLAYLRVLANPADAVSLERMVGTPPRGIGAKTFEAIGELAARREYHGVRGDGPARDLLEGRAANRQAGRRCSIRWMHDLAERAPPS